MIDTFFDGVALLCAELQHNLEFVQGVFCMLDTCFCR